MDYYYQHGSASNCSKGFKKITRLIKSLCPSNPESVIYSYIVHCNFGKPILKYLQSSLERNKYTIIPQFMKEYLDGLEKKEFEKY